MHHHQQTEENAPNAEAHAMRIDEVAPPPAALGSVAGDTTAGGRVCSTGAARGDSGGTGGESGGS